MKILSFAITVLSVFLHSELVAIPPVWIEGYVYQDKNNNGKFDSEDRPLNDVFLSNGKDLVKSNSEGYYSLSSIDGRPVFLVKPAGWQVSDKSYMEPFFYFYPSENGNKRQRRDFALVTQDESGPFTIALLGDPQPHNIDEVYDYIRSTVDEIGSNAIDFSVSLGDLAGVYNPLLKQANAGIGKPAYYVFGNHDNAKEYNQERQEVDAVREFSGVFGPDYYAFSWGNTNFLVINNVFPAKYINGKEFVTAIGDDQWRFIANYLENADKNKLLVVFSHDHPQHLSEPARFYNLFNGFSNVAFICGHLHTVEQHYITKAEGWPNKNDTHWFSAGATCGGWWRGERDIYGIPSAMQIDGTPKGYVLMKIQPDGHFSYRYKCSGLDTNQQMHIYTWDYRLFDPMFAPAETPKREVYANVYLGNERSVVKMRLDGGPWITMQKVRETDPYLEMLMKQQGAGRFPTQAAIGYKNSKQSEHLWKAEYPESLSPGVHQVEVLAQGDFGLDTKAFHSIIIPSEEIKSISKKLDIDYKKWAAPSLLKKE